MPPIGALRFRAAVLWAAILHIYVANGLGLQNGQTYTLRVAKSGTCGGRFLAYNNKTCGAVGSGPLLQSDKAAAAKWRTWRVTVISRIDVRGYKVTLQAASPPKAKLRCPGYLAVARSGACPNGSASSAVALAKTNKTISSQWIMMHVDGIDSIFTVVAAGRRVACPRYLGASTSCLALRPQLYQNDDRTGRQHWKVVAAGSPPPVLPGAPKLHDHDLQRWYVDLFWDDGTPGSPQEQYKVACMRAGDLCDAEPVVASSIGIARGSGKGRLGLPSAEKNLTCYVIASNAAGSTCSEGVPAKGKVLEREDLPTVTFLVYETYVRVKWSGGATFFPEEAYKTWCVGSGQGYDAPPAGSGVATAWRGQRYATVRGLQRSTNYTCFLDMSNGSVWYPFAERITTLSRPRQSPTAPTDVQAMMVLPPGPADWRTNVHLSVIWKDGQPAYPEEKYMVKCLEPGEPFTCNIGDYSDIYGDYVNRGVQNSTFNWHWGKDTTYDCYVVAVSSPSPPACSQPVRVPPIVQRKPSAPTAVGGMVSSMGWGAEWTDAAVFGYQKDLDNPFEYYSAFCLPPSGTCTADCSCSAASVGRNMTVSRGIQHANVLDLEKSSSYNCYVMAWNKYGKACSEGYSIKTLEYSRLPSPPVITGYTMDLVRWNDSESQALPILETYFYAFRFPGDPNFGGPFECAAAWFQWPGTARGVGEMTLETSPWFDAPELYVIARSPGQPDVCSEPIIHPGMPFDYPKLPVGKNSAEFWAYAASPVPVGGRTVNVFVWYSSVWFVSGVKCEVTGIKASGAELREWRLCVEGSPTCLITDLPLKANVLCRLYMRPNPVNAWTLPEPVLNVTLDF